MRILIYTGALVAGGVESLLLNTISEADKKLYQFDIMTYNNSENDWAYKFEELGCNIHYMQNPAKLGFLQSIITCRKFFKQGNYDIIHSQIGFTSILPLIANASLSKPKALFICHSHFDNYPFSKVTKAILRWLFKIIQCKKLACSNGAGYELYGKKADFTWLKNGIDTQRFSYNEQIRQEVRKDLGISNDEFVIGTVGRMCYQKNHEFLVKIFDKIVEQHSNSRLILIGDGELRDDIQSQIKGLNLEKKVLFLGKRNDVNRLLQSLDVFIMPTRFEGLSLALLEVQCSGLPCLTSDQVPPEAKILSNFEMLPLEEGELYWAERALSYLDKERKDGVPFVEKAGFDKKTAAQMWLGVYDEIMNNKR